ncbi:MAG: hypothetical protein KF746_23305 [Chitinophagaceae bacterium]|nr:hypothetical protein [Chitinophagaceae bacterium]
MILGQSVTPCEGEVSIKSYQCTQFNSRLFGLKADGHLEVTNKRLLFQALGKGMSGWSVLHNEVAIGDVSDIKIYKGNSFNILMFIIGISILLVLSIAVSGRLSPFSDPSTLQTLLALAVLGGGGYFLWNRCKKESFSLVINTKGGSGNVVYIAGLSPFGGGTSIAKKALEGLPSRDSEILFKEIGAVVLDIQKMGNNAIERWKNKS